MLAANNNRGVHRILVRPEIDTPEAVKGKKIAITTFGSSSHQVLTMVLDVWKMRPDERNPARRLVADHAHQHAKRSWSMVPC